MCCSRRSGSRPCRSCSSGRRTGRTRPCTGTRRRRTRRRGGSSRRCARTAGRPCCSRRRPRRARPGRQDTGEGAGEEGPESAPPRGDERAGQAVEPFSVHWGSVLEPARVTMSHLIDVGTRAGGGGPGGAAPALIPPPADATPPLAYGPGGDGASVAVPGLGGPATQFGAANGVPAVRRAGPAIRQAGQRLGMTGTPRRMQSRPDVLRSIWIRAPLPSSPRGAAFVCRGMSCRDCYASSALVLKAPTAYQSGSICSWGVLGDGNSSQVRPSSIRPPAFGVRPPHAYGSRQRPP